MKHRMPITKPPNLKDEKWIVNGVSFQKFFLKNLNNILILLIKYIA